MNYVKQFFVGNYHPITELLLTRSDISNLPRISIDSFDFKAFIDVFDIDRNEIFIIDSALKSNNDLKSAFSNVIIKFMWNEQLTLDILNRFQKNGCLSPHLIIVLHFQILFFIINDDNKYDSFQYSRILFSICALYPSFNNSILRVFFFEALKSHMECRPLEWENESIINVIQYYIIDPEIGPEFAPYFEHILQFSIDNQIHEVINNILDSTSILLSEKKLWVSNDDYIRLVSLINPLFKVQNLNAISILCQLSSINSSPIIKECFFVISTALVEYLNNSPPLLCPEFCKYYYNEEEKEYIWWKENTNQKNFTFLENGIEYKQMDDVLQYAELLPDKAFKHIIQITDSLKKAGDSGVDFFLSSMSIILKSHHNNQHYFDIYAMFLFLVSELCSQTSIVHLMDAILSKLVFDPTIEFFHNIDRIIHSLRYHSLKIIFGNAPSLIVTLFEFQPYNPFYISEIIARSLHQMNMMYLSSNVFMRSFSKGLYSMYDLLNRDSTVSIVEAFQTYIYFGVGVLSDTIDFKYFAKNEVFIRSVFNMIFVKSLSRMVLLTFRDMLIKCSSLDVNAFSCIVNEFFEITRFIDESEDTFEIVIEVLKMLLDSFNSNSSIIMCFIPISEKLFSLVTKYKSNEMLIYSLKILQIMASNSQSLVFSSELVKILIIAISHIQGDNPTGQVYLILLNIFGSRSALGSDSVFLIQNPFIIPVILGSFGKSKKILEIINTFYSLCISSPINCISCHEGGLDVILLTLLNNYYLMGSKTVEYRGSSFELQIDDSSIFKDIFPLIRSIISYRTSNCVLCLLIKLVLQTSNQQVSYDTALFINSVISQQKSGNCIIFPIHTPESSARIFRIKPQTLNRMFSISFWIKIDKLISLEIKSDVNIIRISDNKESVLSIVINHGSVFIINRTSGSDYVFNCNQSIPSNTMKFFTIVAQRSSAEKSAVGVFIDGQMTYCQEIPKIFFDTDEEIVLDLGGGIEQYSQPVAYLQSIGINSTLLSESTILRIFSEGPKSYKWIDGFIFNSDALDSPRDQTDVDYSILKKYQIEDSITDVFLEGYHYHGLLEVFSHQHLYSDKMVELVLSIIQLNLLNYDSQSDVVGLFCLISAFLQKMPSSYLSYQLYQALYSFSDIIHDKTHFMDFFDTIVLNWDLWFSSNTSVIIRITHHWANTVSQHCLNMFKRDGFRLKLLKQVDSKINMIKKSKSINPEDAEKMISNIIGIFENSTESLCEKDGEFIISLLFKSYDNYEKSGDSSIVILYLNLISRFGSSFSKIESSEFDIPEFLLFFIESDDHNIVISSFQALFTIQKDNIDHYISVASIILNLNPIKNYLFNRILPKLIFYPHFCNVLVILSISMGEDEKNLSAAGLKAISDLTIPKSQYSSSELWCLWAVLLSTQLKGESLVSIYEYIAYNIIHSDNAYSEFERVLLVRKIILGVTNCNTSESLLYLFQVILKSEKIPRLDLLILLVFDSIIHLNNICMNQILYESWKQSPFTNSHDLFFFESVNISNVIELHQYISTFASEIKCKYSVFISDNGSISNYDEIVFFLDQSKDFLSIEILNASFKSLKSLIMNDKSNDNIGIDFITSYFNNKYGSRIKKEIGYINSFFDSLSRISSSISQDMKNTSLKNCMIINNSISLKSSCDTTVIEQYKEYLVDSTLLSSVLYVENKDSSFGFAFQPLYSSKSVNLDDLIESIEKIVIFKYPKMFGGSSSEFSLPAIEWVFNQQYSSCFSLNKESIQIMRSHVVYINIQMDQIWFILERSINNNNSAIEIFTHDHQSYLLDFYPISSKTIMERFSTTRIDILKYPLIVLSEILGQMSVLTNIEIILLLSIFSGYSYHCSLLWRELNIGGFKVSPMSLLYSTLNNIEDLKKLTEIRMKMEISDIHKIIDDEYPDFSILKPLLFGNLDQSKIKQSNKLYICLEDIHFVSFIDDNSIVTVDINGRITFLCICESRINEYSSHFIPDIIYTSDFRTNGKCLYINIQKQYKIYIISSERIIFHHYQFNFSLICDFNRYFIYCKNRCGIYKSMNDFSNESRIANCSSDICCLATNECHPIIAYGTSSCNVIVKSFSNNECISMVSLEGNESKNILISSAYGFIIVNVGYSIYVFLFNGLFIGKLDHKWQIIRMITFIGHYGYDYVAFTDSRYNLIVFQCMNPNSTGIIKSFNTSVLSLSYDSKSSRIMSLLASGELHMDSIGDLLK